jgi:hypothetical protein
MRKFVYLAGALACLSLGGCGDTVSQAEADTVAQAPKKSLARKAPMYAGQDNIQSISTATVEPGPDGAVVLKASGATAGAGFTDVGFLPRVYAATPPDGIYEVDVVAQAPASPGAATPTPVDAKVTWDKYRDGRVKGVKFISKTNEVVAMLPAAGGAPAGN